MSGKVSSMIAPVAASAGPMVSGKAGISAAFSRRRSMSFSRVESSIEAASHSTEAMVACSHSSGTGRSSTARSMTSR